MDDHLAKDLKDQMIVMLLKDNIELRSRLKEKEEMLKSDSYTLGMMLSKQHALEKKLEACECNSYSNCLQEGI